MVENGNVIEKIKNEEPILEICLFSEFKESSLEADKQIRRQLNEQHRFDFYVWLWVNEGECLHWLDFQQVRQSAGEWLLIKPQQVHHFLSMDGWDGWGLSFPAQWLLTEWAQALPTQQLITPSQAKLLEPALQQLKQCRYFDWQDKPFLPLVKAQLQSFILLLRTLYDAPQQPTTPQNQRWQQFQQLLEQHFHTQHQVHFYAEKLACTEKTLGNVCLSQTGQSVKSLINQRLQLEAKRLLVYTSLSVKQIALQLGFEEATYFNKFFKKQAQCTPKVFREKYEMGYLMP